MSTDSFFERQTPESRAKTDIVASFFPAWLNIIGAVSQGPLAYMELFAGAGTFEEDGTKSTPILVLEHVISSPYASRFRIILNEMEEESADKLESTVMSLPGINRLRERPILLREEVVLENSLKFLKHLGDFPAVLFVDPFGYKGLSRQLFARFMNVGWGRDAILFFNYRRINAAISNPEFVEHMDAIFGRDRARDLRETLAGLNPRDREKQVHAAMEEALHEVGVKYVHRYDFEKRHDSLFFMSQKEKGLRVMKNIMQKRSHRDASGIPSFSYSRNGAQPQQLGLFSQSKTPLEELHGALLERFAGHLMTFEQIFLEHHPNTNYVEKNYRDVLLEMEAHGEIEVSPKKRRSGTFGPAVKVKFPVRGK